MLTCFFSGGLIRNIFAPIASGGSAVCCPAFEPNLFWDVVEELGPTWYYASPSMHQMILDLGASRPAALALAKRQMRLVCNAAGGLLPALAVRIRDTFDCIVLPSYGMTECMPISTPPIDYKLDRPGTSGIAVGPQLSILDWNEAHVSSGTIGRICVRAEPVFPGYLLPSGELDKSPFNKEGWFDTGDLGYLDKDGYLFITGRSKEVINRGGEIVSPFEVENAIVTSSQAVGSPIFHRVSQALAFSAKHDVLQEVVGVVLVTPPGVLRVDLRQLHKALASSLQKAKWPSMVVYMEDLPKRNNKVLRIKLGERLGIPELTDATSYGEAHWEGTCPPPDTELSVSIPANRCAVDETKVSKALASLCPPGVESAIQRNTQAGTTEVYLGPDMASLEDSKDFLRKHGKETVTDLTAALPLLLDGYLVPHRYHILDDPIPYLDDGTLDVIRLEKQIQAQRQRENASQANCNTPADRVTRIFASILDVPASDISRDADFFELGGDSIRAGKLLSSLRSEFAGVPIPIDLIFRGGSVAAIAEHIDANKPSMPGSIPSSSDGSSSGSSHIRRHSQTNPIVLLIQLLPLVVFFPIRRASQWTVFVLMLGYFKADATFGPLISHIAGRLTAIAMSLLITRLSVRLVAPLVGVALKWIIVGRYREGLYPMWGLYHTQWWLAQKLVDVCGIGVWGSCNLTRIWYYRLLGAKIGRNVEIHSHAQIGEWDLVEIGDGSVLEEGVICRPFGAERNTSMHLGRIVLGKDVTVGVASIVAPGAKLKDGTHIGPNSSSWEAERDAKEENRDYAPSRMPKPHWTLEVFGTLPVLAAVRGFAAVPWLLGLLGLVSVEFREDAETPIHSIIHWFAGRDRVLYHLLTEVLGSVFGPIFMFGMVLLVKKVLDAIFGELQPGRADQRGNVEKWRMWLMREMYPAGRLHKLTTLFGQHYEMTSVILRLLGAKAGKRVYWPGTGPGIGDYHLVDVGNDVVFGSRAHFITSDATGSEKVTVKSRAMIADRVVCLPGVTVGEETVLGSGALGKRDKQFPAGGVYVGSKGGDALCLSSGSSSPPRLNTPTDDGGDFKEMMLGSSGTSTAKSNISSASTLTFNSSGSSIRSQSPDRGLDVGQKSMDFPSSCEKGHTRESHRPVSPSESESSRRSSDEIDPDKLTPFGRAYYMHQAPYHVFGIYTITFYSVLVRVITTMYWSVPFLGSTQLLHLLLSHDYTHHSAVTRAVVTNPLALFAMFAGFFSILITTQSIVALAVVLAAKWLLLGRRTPGNYDWDKSSYCQRWQLFLAIESLRREFCFQGCGGVLGMLTSTWYIVLYFRAMGAKIGRNCALFANGSPSLWFTEPDLLTLGDRVVVDDASLVGHVNARGKFDLNRLKVGEGCVLRTGSRLLSGAGMEDGAMLLEHTLVMGGDLVEAGRTMQGWPADFFMGETVCLDGKRE